MAKLVFISSPFLGRTYEFLIEKTSVCRAETNLLVIADNSVSAAHCEILVNGPEVIVRDLGSRNGTWVNGLRLRNQQYELKPGEKVRFGSVEARLELAPEDREEPYTDATAIYTLFRDLRYLQRTQERLNRARAIQEKSSGSSPAMRRDLPPVRGCPFATIQFALNGLHICQLKTVEFQCQRNQ